MAKNRNPSQNFTVKDDAIFLTGAKKKLSPQEEAQLRNALNRRYLNNMLKTLGKAIQTYNENRRQSVTDNP